MHIHFQDNTQTVTAENIDLLQNILLFAANKEKVPQEAEVSVNFVNNQEIQEINRNYRQIDKPTDVISFALLDPVEGDVGIIGGNIPLALGDIVISVDKANEQADEYNHSYERELSFLAVHGFLHLLGYDHMNQEDEKEMFEKQELILGEFNLGR
ncbi:rRNA maturation RNase YbeY [Virgibacillus sp. MSJ-26]|uniref:rRNA maturation RNase YbeY n=1 Tax=Virgibacillus sp. MSJ-26 TaxID=2841522 RepID=UPI001C0FC3A0|nr:rRNA maturation RNase YbeY [Virgibacillus sp. MSJ-26]MBU5466429.1 rRNA maturation RNase YbeY [Virgibacillus sp. MSJ-26]